MLTPITRVPLLFALSLSAGIAYAQVPARPGPAVPAGPPGSYEESVESLHAEIIRLEGEVARLRAEVERLRGTPAYPYWGPRRPFRIFIPPSY